VSRKASGSIVSLAIIQDLANKRASLARESFSWSERLKTYADENYSLKLVGHGAYACVYSIPNRPGLVLKVSRAMEGTADFIEWSMLRRLKYGINSPEMNNLPEVHDYGRVGTGWFAVLKEYRGIEAMQMQDYDAYAKLPYWCDAILTMTKILAEIFGVDKWSMDLHNGNVMWCGERKQWIITDPFCNDAKGSPAKQPRFYAKPPAGWKRSPLQQLAGHR
jgi:hypothetical protein